VLAALCALMIALLWILGAVFLLDVILDSFGSAMGVLERLVLFALGTLVMVWVYARFAAPWLAVRETTTDMALFVERQQQIDSDLVAAMQFESAEAPRWGSVQLEQAVIDHVGQFSRGLNVFVGMDYFTVTLRGVILGGTLACALLVVVLFPAHTGIFGRRLLLSAAHYPTDTVIESIEVNGQAVPLSPREPVVIRVGYGQPVEFAVRCSGDIPEAGEVHLRSVVSGKKNPVELAEIDQPGDIHEFRGQLERLLDDVKYKIYLGDAWTDPRPVKVIPLPVVEARLKVVPPEYARQSADPPTADPGSLQVSVIESSEVQVEFESSKPLTEAVLTIENAAEPAQHNLVAIDGESRIWALRDENTPFTRVESPIRFELSVTDEDGLRLESPLKGYVRLKSDRRPQVTGSIVHRVVLPDAKPVIELRASDDYGIAELALNVEIVRSRQDGKEDVDGASTPADAQQRIVVTSLLEPVANGDNGASSNKGETRSEVTVEFPARGDVLPIVGGYRFDLAGIGLVKGDQLRLTLEATDYRGKLQGRVTASEPMVVEVSDQSGVLAAISEVDEQSEERMTDLIRRELGIGESP
jgi:hypothetical protein